PQLRPQATSGSVGGTVRDQSGSVVPGADVSLRNTSTGVSFANKTSAEGVYFFPTVPPGTYEVSAQSSGMDKFVASFPIQVAQSVVIDPVLKPGQIATKVDVEAVSPMVVTDNSPIEARLDRQRIQDLPINGRSLQSILNTIPNVGFGAASGSRDFLIDGV